MRIQQRTGNERRPAPSATLDELVVRSRRLIAAGSRSILGISGTPGSGKSTLSVALADALGEDAVLVGMDAFHLANRELLRLGRHNRKGAPDTFDVDGYVALLARLAVPSNRDIYAPIFDRAREEPIGSAVPVHPSAKLVITEGNYLLMDKYGWDAVSAYLDESWFIVVSPVLRRERLVRRRMSYGHSLDAATRWVDEVDEVNASVIEETSDRADLVVRLVTPL
ncbi:MAG TPA: nucleoside/nucleotide kinase family protein [Mycetocola sp.]|nr:nucleoside/nucleotide kinase family protein [Mycetocola sp.]